MMLLRWVSKMLVDVILFGFVNRSFAMSVALLAFLVIGLSIVTAQISAPFIYTLF